ncbi:MAG: peptidoglycan D,D-transpeptidase FtsI family protein [Phycisphaerales bacterium JB037]
MTPRRDWVTALCTWGLTLVLVALLGRAVQLQIAPGEQLREHMAGHLSERPVPALRGSLLDRRGRLLATTRFGYRAFVDPAALAELPPAELDALIVRAARATGEPAEEIGTAILEALGENEQRAAALAAGEPLRDDKGRVKKVIRFLPISPVLTPDAAEPVRGIEHLHLEQRAVREYPAGDEVAALVGKVGFEHEGRLGAELSLNDRLEAEAGRLRFVRDAGGKPLWVDPEHWEPGESGHDVRLSIDLVVQRIVLEELERGVEEADAAGGRAVVIDPDTGEVLAMVDHLREVPGLLEVPWEDKDAPRIAPEPLPEGAARPRYRSIRPDEHRDSDAAMARNRCVEDLYEPGSTFKPFIWAELTARGVVAPDDTVDTEGGRWRTGYGRPIEDVSRRDEMTWREVLLRSSNIGMVKMGERVDGSALRGVMTRFGFGSKTNIGLPGETGGIVTELKDWNKYTHTSVCFGHEIAVTPVQMARAFAAFARQGDKAGTVPELSLRAGGPEGGLRRWRATPISVCNEIRPILRGVANSMERVMKQRYPDEGPWKYSMFGKSGTADVPLGPAPEGKRRPTGWRGYFDEQYNSSFIAAGPVDAPRLVVIVVIDDPGPGRIRTRTHYGSHVAGPVVRRIMERSLAYLGVPPDQAEDLAAADEN